jgi:hypothetical protein
MTNNSLEPLSIGNTLHTAVRLYRDRFQTYAFFAVRAALWSLVPLILQLVFSQLLYQTIIPEDGSDLGLRLFLLPIQIFCAAQSIFNCAVISRLAFQDIIYQPETSGEAARKVRPKMWRLLWMQILLGLLAFLLMVSIMITLTLATFLPIIGVLLILAAFLCLPWVLYWFSARFLPAELPLIIEDNLSSWQAIKRSWHLTKNSAWRILGLIFIASLIVAPIYLLSSALASIPIWATAASLFNNLESIEDWETITENPLFLRQLAMFSFGLTFIFSLLNILLVPFWQSLKSVIYHDLLRQSKLEKDRNQELSSI